MSDKVKKEDNPFDNEDDLVLFLDSVYKIIDHEGGYVDDKDDRGGRTKYGISQRAYPNFDIKSITKDDAISIYYQDYYRKFRINELPVNVRYWSFDSAVNMDGSRMTKILQQVVNIKGGNLVVDGRIGKNTIAQTKYFIRLLFQ